MNQSDQNRIQEPLQDHQSGPKGIQMEAQAPPRASQEKPKSSKEVQSEPKASQGEAKWAQDVPKGGQRAPKKTPKLSPRGAQGPSKKVMLENVTEHRYLRCFVIANVAI